MAYSHCLRLSQPSCRPSPKFPISATATATAVAGNFSLSLPHRRTAISLSSLPRLTAPRRISARATENGSETASEPETTTSTADPADSGETEVSDVGAEIRKALKERESREEKLGLLSGVAEEIGEIEWPEFRKVIGITGVVLGVIAGSSVVLLTVNAVLAELSDRVFAGRGVQDFFG